MTNEDTDIVGRLLEAGSLHLAVSLAPEDYRRVFELFNNRRKNSEDET